MAEFRFWIVADREYRNGYKWADYFEARSCDNIKHISGDCVAVYKTEKDAKAAAAIMNEGRRCPWDVDGFFDVERIRGGE